MWEDLSPQQRQRGLMILAGGGVLVVLLVVLAFSLGGGDDEAQASAASPSPTIRGDVSAWFEGTAEVRGEVMAAATGVRTFVEANDGLQLQPACVMLGTQAAAAKAHPAAPDAEIQKLWSGGAASFAEAAQWCVKLWDGTPMAPTAILAEVTGALDTAEATWEELASRVGQPLPPLPSGTFLMPDGTTRTTSPTATPTPSAASTLTATTTPTGEPGVTLPSITLPTFGAPSATTTATATTSATASGNPLG